MNMEITFWQVTCITIYGIEVDSIDMVSRLPLDKLKKCRNLVRQFRSRKKVALRELQSLIGVLNLACLVVVPGRAFLRRLIDLKIGILKPHYLIRFNKEVRADLTMWLHFLENFNGKSVLFPVEWESSDITRYLQMHLVC